MTASQGAQGTIDSDDFHYTEWSVVRYLPQPDETSETLHSVRKWMCWDREGFGEAEHKASLFADGVEGLDAW